MSSIAENKVSNAQPPEKMAGMISHGQAIELIQSMSENSEYNQQVSGRVIKVYSSQSDLPSRTRKDGVKTYAWEMHGNVDVKLNHNNKLLKNIGPLCSHFNCMPLIDEEVILDEHDGQIFYSFPLNRMGGVNHNRTKKIVGEEQVFESTTYFARPVFSFHGDTTMQGRFGNYMMLSSEPDKNGYRAYPKIIIGNNQDRDTIQSGHKNFDKHFPHFHNVNTIGSAIEITSNPDTADIQPAAMELDQEEFFDSTGDAITITSDTLIFNAKEAAYVSSGNDINITAQDEVNIATIEGRVSLGKTDSTSPIVRGVGFKTFMTKLVNSMDAFCGILTTFEGDGAAQIQSAADSLKRSLESLKTDLDRNHMMSKKVFSE